MPADRAAITAAKGRLRPIIMTACAMISGMIPMSLGLEEGSEQNAPLGRAVIGGMALATFATLLVLPAVFTLLLHEAYDRSPSLDPDDPESSHYDPIHADGHHFAESDGTGQPATGPPWQRSRQPDLLTRTLPGPARPIFLTRDLQWSNASCACPTPSAGAVGKRASSFSSAWSLADCSS